MRGGRVWTTLWIPALLVLVISFGCGTKQTVKSTESVPQQQATAPETATAAQPAAPAREPVVSESVPPAAPAGGSPEAQKRTEVAQAGAAEAAGIAATQEKASAFEDIRFDFDKAIIRDDAKPVLAKVAAALKNGGIRLVVEGHCDERGTAEYNMALGERRAESARAYLLSLGVSKEALSTVSFGKEKPLDPDHTEAAWAKNRRAHFVRK